MADWFQVPAFQLPLAKQRARQTLQSCSLLPCSQLSMLLWQTDLCNVILYFRVNVDVACGDIRQFSGVRTVLLGSDAVPYQKIGLGDASDYGNHCCRISQRRRQYIHRWGMFP